MKQLIEAIGILFLIGVVTFMVCAAWAVLFSKTGWDDEE